MTIANFEIQTQLIAVNGVELNVASAGHGPAILLLHGWPHTWEIWREMIPTLAQQYTVVAPDLRGLGASSRTNRGYDAQNLAEDAAALLVKLEITSAMAVGIDLGVQSAWMLAMEHSELVTGLVLMEGILAGVPGAEQFLRNGPPWWFGFHNVPQLAERVLEGHENEYIDWFMRNGTSGGKGIPADIQARFVHAYSGREALRCGFEHYRAFPLSAEQNAAVLQHRRLLQPTLAIAGGVVGDAIGRQLSAMSDHLVHRKIEDCAHLIPLEQPNKLAAMLHEHYLTVLG
jgi:pimeloyl-ACP methyl ester carboxylesterase